MEATDIFTEIREYFTCKFKIAVVSENPYSIRKALSVQLPASCGGGWLGIGHIRAKKSGTGRQFEYNLMRPNSHCDNVYSAGSTDEKTTALKRVAQALNWAADEIARREKVIALQNELKRRDIIRKRLDAEGILHKPMHPDRPHEYVELAQGGRAHLDDAGDLYLSVHVLDATPDQYKKIIALMRGES